MSCVPVFSICIPAYNNLAAFARCLDSVLAQSERSIECVIQDDSTTEDIAVYIARLHEERVRYTRNARNLGAPKNWNAALARAQGGIVTLLHQDDWYRYPDVLQRIHEVMERAAADVLVTGRALYERGACIGEYADIAPCQKAFLRDFPGKSLVVNRLGHPSVFFFRSSLKHILYDEALYYFSDTEYYKRLLGSAHTLRVLSEPLVALERGAGGQFSSHCLSRPESLADELLYALDKHKAHAVEKGMASARFVMSHVRHWRRSGMVKLLRYMARLLRRREFFILLATLPFFGGHMAYRFAYRRIMGRPWA